MRLFWLSCLLFAISLPAAQPDPLWDGHESVAAYAQRTHHEPAKTLNLGNGVTLELVLIPAGKFIMGTPEPEKPTITVFSAQLLIGIGAALTLTLLLYLLLHRRTSRRLSFSLRCLMVFTAAFSIMVWGGTGWYLACEKAMVYRQDEKPHPVLTSKAFYMGKYPVTQAQYEVLMGQNPSWFKGRPNNPVEFVSWGDASAFCTALNERFQTDALKAHLPTAAQWEYACRAGTQTQFYSGDRDTDLNAVAWYTSNSGGKPHPVGGKAPNAFGLYDMHGNVWQWCQDLYRQDYEEMSGTDPVNNFEGNARVLRGGSWDVSPNVCRSAYRISLAPDNRSWYSGFRIVISFE